MNSSRSYFRDIIGVVSMFLPQAAKKSLLRRTHKFSIARDARIGFSLLRVDNLVMQEGSRLGNFNVFSNVSTVVLHKHAHVGSYNYFTGRSRSVPSRTPSPGNTGFPTLDLGEQATISSMHYFDITDNIRIGDYSTIAGKASQFWTHGISMEKNCQVRGPIAIGRYCLVGSSVRFVANSGIADGTVVGAGAVVTKQLVDSYCLVGGVPAKCLKKLDKAGLYFNRKLGKVDWPDEECHVSSR